MKYWEIVKSLSENPSWSGAAAIDSIRYELYVDDSGTLQSATYYLKLGTKGTSIGKAGNIDFDGWEIVHQPVTWQEAIQAWAAGKIVSVEIGGRKFELMHDDSVFGPSKRMINLGTWYVED